MEANSAGTAAFIAEQASVVFSAGESHLATCASLVHKIPWL